MRNFESPISVDLNGSVLEELIASLKPEQTLTATVILSALDEPGEAEAFEELNMLSVPVDISDLPRTGGAGEAALRLRREAQLAKQGNLLGALEENDPLRLYLEEIAAIPVCGDIRLLAEELMKANIQGREEPALVQKLFNLSLSRVVEIAREYTGYGVLLLDLIQEGSMNLWRCLPCYPGDDFESFRDQCIHYSMKKAVILQAYADGVGQKMRQAMEDYKAVDERLVAELGRNPTLEEIAEQIHMTQEETLAVKKMLENARLVSQAKKPVEPEEEPEEEAQHVEDTALFQMRQRIMDLLSGLKEEDAKLLTLRFGLEGGIPLSPEETGRRMGLTPEEVVQREAAALARLRQV